LLKLKIVFNQYEEPLAVSTTEMGKSEIVTKRDAWTGTGFAGPEVDRFLKEKPENLGSPPC
jgi:hypothetical protein